jgi:fatty-acyl-CoA synthase
MMQGLMQDWPLTLNRIIQHTAKWHGDCEVVRRRPDGSLDRASYAVEVVARRFSSALQSLGIASGDRVATMAMNSGRHLECWYGIMGLGAICHTLNPRLFNADLEYIVNRAADSVVIVDRSLAAKLVGVLPAYPSVRHVVGRCPRGWSCGRSRRRRRARSPTICTRKLAHPRQIG